MWETRERIGPSGSRVFASESVMAISLDIHGDVTNSEVYKCTVFFLTELASSSVMSQLYFRTNVLFNVSLNNNTYCLSTIDFEFIFLFKN